MTILDCVVVGAGQAGLGISYYLKQDNRQHIVFDKGRVAIVAIQRWDHSTEYHKFHERLTGLPYDGPERMAFGAAPNWSIIFKATLSASNCRSDRGSRWFRSSRMKTNRFSLLKPAARTIKWVLPEPFHRHRLRCPTYTKISCDTCPGTYDHNPTAFIRLP